MKGRELSERREELLDDKWHASEAGLPHKYYKLTPVGRIQLADAHYLQQAQSRLKSDLDRDEVMHDL